ncbi:MAG: NgoFVII family restriction endonuclease [Clostridia bacterium]|nr:NgoFVII family restriction endonuclease [Clostridia bacterium]
MPRLELFSPRQGGVPTRSGLNWGFADAHVSTADAYIALRKDFLVRFPTFFPPHGSIIHVVWDDGVRMNCLLEGTQEINGDIVPKQISTYDDKSELGVYLRDRMGIAYNHRITINDLWDYGRTDIEVSLLDDGSYYFDFSV